ncbi:hypothetical protein YC2023_037090 [Brassica napus]
MLKSENSPKNGEKSANKVVSSPQSKFNLKAIAQSPANIGLVRHGFIRKNTILLTILLWLAVAET